MRRRRSNIVDAFRQILFLLIGAGALGFTVNAMRPIGLLLIGDWSAEARLKSDSGESLIIPLEDAKGLYATGGAVFLDARGPQDYREGHILGAKNLPWQAFDKHAEAVLRDLPEDGVIIAYCDGESCSLSEELAKTLIDLGYEGVRVLVNGWTRWVQAGLPTAKGTQESGS